MVTWIRELHAQQASTPDLVVFLAVCVALFLLAAWAIYTAVVLLRWAFGWRPAQRLREILIRPSFAGARQRAGEYVLMSLIMMFFVFVVTAKHAVVDRVLSAQLAGNSGAMPPARPPHACGWSPISAPRWQASR